MTFVLFTAFAAATAAMLAVGLVVRDLSLRRFSPIDRRLGIGSTAKITSSLTRRQPIGSGTIDQAFARLIFQSGSNVDVSTALSVVIGAGSLGCVAGLLLLESLLAAAVGLLLAVAMPLAFWSIRRARRHRDMVRQLPDTLDLLADGVRSGRNLQQASELVAAEMSGPLAEEFDYCASQLRLGHKPTAVLERMVRRIAIAEFKLFAIAIMVHGKTGGNLALLIDRLSAASRDRQQFHGHLNAVTSGSRLSAIGLIVGSIVGVATLAAIEPSYLMGFIEHSAGPTLLVVAGCLQAVGVVWLWRILRVRY